MTLTEIARVLEKHGIAYEIINGKIIAEDSYTLNGVLHTDTLDLTGVSPKQLYDWLGY